MVQGTQLARLRLRGSSRGSRVLTLRPWEPLVKPPKAATGQSRRTADSRASFQVHCFKAAVPDGARRLRVACSAGSSFKPIDPKAGKKLILAPITLHPPRNDLTKLPGAGPRGVFLVGFSAEEGDMLRCWLQQMEPGFVVSHCPAAMLADKKATLRQALGLSPAAPAPAPAAPAAGEAGAAAAAAAASPASVAPTQATAVPAQEGQAGSLDAPSYGEDDVEILASQPEEERLQLRLPEQAWEPAPTWFPPVVLFTGITGEEIVGLIELWPDELDQDKTADQDATSFAAVSEGLLDKPLSRLLFDIARAKLQERTSAPPVPEEAPAGDTAADDEQETGLNSKVREYMLVNPAGELEDQPLSLAALREELRSRAREQKQGRDAAEGSSDGVQKGKKGGKREKQLDPEDDRVRAALLESRKQGRAKGRKGDGFGAGGGKPRGFG